MSGCPRAPSSVRNCGAPVAIEPASERRLVTVVFVDLVGSTKLASHLDPERFREVLAAFHRMVTEEVEWLRGRAESFIGDAVLTVFGVPTVARRRRRAGDPGRALRGGPGAAARARARAPVPHGGPRGDQHRPGRGRDRRRPRHRDRRRGEHRRAAAAGGRARRGPGRVDHAPAGEGRRGVRRDAHDPPEGVRPRDRGVAGDPSGAALDARPRSRSSIGAASSRCSPTRSNGCRSAAARTW